MSNFKTCTHIKVTGVRCDSPALRGEQFCYFHQRLHRGVRTPPQARLHPIANFEDEESIQAALMEVTNALMRNTIDLKRATLILRALHIAVKNANRVKFNIHGGSAVREVPDFAPPQNSDETVEAEQAMEIPAFDPYASRSTFKIRTAKERAAETNYRVPTASEAAQRRSKLLADYYGYPTVEAYKAALKARGKPTPYQAAEDQHPLPTRKPPQTVRTTEAPKQRNIAAQSPP